MRTRKLPRVTAKNYFTSEINMAYLSASQIKAFMQCEAAAMAELNREHVREESTAMLVGSYVDAYFSRSLPQFKSDHPELYTGKGDLKAEYKKADRIIYRIQEDKLFMALMSGRKQTIRTGSIGGIPFKVKVDSLLPAKKCLVISERFPGVAETLMFADGAIVDLKVMRDFERVWKPGAGRVSFVEAWGYDLQLAVYQEIVGGQLPCFIAAVTKEEEPDIEVFMIPQEEMDAKLMQVEELAPRYAAIKRGEIEPDRCGRCAYCRRTKVLTGPQDYRYYKMEEERV